MLAVGLDAASKPQHVILIDSDSGHAHDSVLALREGAGLVEQESVDSSALLEGEAVLDQDAVPGCQRGRN